eukprot:800847-Pyramimonas_sp.AAC.1
MPGSKKLARQDLREVRRPSWRPLLTPHHPAARALLLAGQSLASRCTGARPAAAARGGGYREGSLAHVDEGGSGA